MNQKLEGLWLGGEISREAAQLVEDAIREHALFRTHVYGDEPRAELIDLANAIRAQIQKLPKPVCDLI